MGETTGQIERHIQNTREDLSTNLSELEHKVKSVTDWRQYFENNPDAFLAAALGGGLLLSLIGSQRQRSRPAPSPLPDIARSAANTGPSGPVSETVGEIKGALIGVAATQAKSFISKLVPGFEEQLARAGKGRSENSIHSV